VRFLQPKGCKSKNGGAARRRVCFWISAFAGMTGKIASAKQGWTLDLGVQGYTGKREGVTGSMRARYSF
jgi:hypothetical protein